MLKLFLIGDPDDYDDDCCLVIANDTEEAARLASESSDRTKEVLFDTPRVLIHKSAAQYDSWCE